MPPRQASNDVGTVCLMTNSYAWAGPCLPTRQRITFHEAKLACRVMIAAKTPRMLQEPGNFNVGIETAVGTETDGCEGSRTYALIRYQNWYEKEVP